MKKKISYYAFAVACGALLGANTAAAQDAVAAETNGPGDIIVTANKRAENVQKVPISIAVLQGEDLKGAGVNSGTQLKQVTTNLQMDVLNGQPLVYIRGMGSANLNAGSEGTVGLYLDGVYLPWATAVDSTFLDLQRVEVLKGPQGSLYGRNTTAGAINYITRDPSDAKALEGAVTIGNKGNRIVTGYAASGPGVWSASLAVQHTEHDAYLKNLVPGGYDAQDRNEWGARAKVKFEPNDQWSAVLAVDWLLKRDFGGSGFIDAASTPPAVGANYGTMDDPDHFYADFQSFGQKYDNVGASFTVRGDLGFAEFVSISAARDTSLWSSPDADASDLPLSNFTAQNYLKSYSQEFQLVSKDPGPLEWVVGLYGFGSAGGLGPTGIFNPGNTGGPSPTEADLILFGRGKAKAYAAYGEAKYSLTDNLRLTGGIRYSWEKRYNSQTTVIVPALNNFVFFDQPDLSKSWDSFDPKVGIDYSWGRQMLYASFTKGFRSGAYNFASPGTPGPVNPEKVDAFEVGGKHTLIDGVRFNWAAYQSKYKDLQVSREVNNGSGSLFLTQNAASAKIKGIEADLQLNLVENLTLNAGVAYNHARYTSFPGASAFLPDTTDGVGLVQGSVDVSGRPLARAPDWTLTASANYTIPLGESRLDLNGSVFWSDDYFLDTPSNVGVDSYEIVNLRATYTLPGDHYSIAVFGNNVTDQRYLTSVSSNAFALIGEPSAPRIWGVTVAAKY